jgi:hypothetical protein
MVDQGGSSLISYILSATTTLHPIILSQEAKLQRLEVEVEKARLEGNNSAKVKLEAAVAAAVNIDLRSRNVDLEKRITTLETASAGSVNLDVYREITRNAEHAFRAAAPVNSAAQAIAVDTPRTDPLLWSKGAVLDWLRALNWQETEMSEFSNNGVTGDILLHDVTPEMCKEWGVSSLHLATMKRLLSRWKPGWGD